MDLSIVILAGGKAKRLGIDKALISIRNKPLIVHTIEKIHSLSDDIIVVTKTEKRLKQLKQVIDYPARFFVDEKPSIESPLIGALTGLRNAKYEQVLLIGCDMPFIKLEVIELLYNYYINATSTCLAVIPQFPNGYIEPLCAIYAKYPSIQAIEHNIIMTSYRFRDFIESISASHFFPVAKIKPIDPELHTFFNVNTRYEIDKLIKILEDSDSI